MTAYSLHGALRFELHGASSLLDYLKMQFVEFEAGPEAEGKVEFSLRIEEFQGKLDPDIRLSGNGESFARVGDEFVWLTSSGRASMNGTSILAEASEVVVGAGFPRMALNRLLEYRFRLAMRSMNAVLVHACCLSDGDAGVVLPAWKGTGKTSLALTLLERGWSFLSDDRIWLRGDGGLLCYPRYLVINASNAQAFSALLDPKERMAHRVHRLMKRSKNFPRLVSKVIGRLIPLPVRYFKLAELFPDAKTPREVSLRNVFFVTRQASNEITWNELRGTQMGGLIRAVADFEWNAELMSLASARDVLFPEGPSWREELDELMRADLENLQSGLESADCARLRLPVEADWPSAANAVEARVKG